MNATYFTLLIGLIFSPIAAAMAFLITYNEYSKHQSINKKKQLWLAIETALLIFILFVIISGVAGFFLGAGN